MHISLDNKFHAARREAAKAAGLLTIREWLLKYFRGDHVISIRASH